MSSTCFEPQASSTGRRFYLQICSVLRSRKLVGWPQCWTPSSAYKTANTDAWKHTVPFKQSIYIYIYIYIYFFSSNTSIITIKSTYKATFFSPIGPSSGLTIGPKHVALYVLLMLITDVLYGNINTVFKHGTHRDK